MSCFHGSILLLFPVSPKPRNADSRSSNFVNNRAETEIHFFHLSSSTIKRYQQIVAKTIDVVFYGHQAIRLD